MLDPRIVRTLDAEEQGHWLVFIARYCSDLYRQVSEGMEENEVLNFMNAIQFASTIEGRLTAGVATEDDIEWLSLAKDEMDEREFVKNPLSTVYIAGKITKPDFVDTKQNAAIDMTEEILKIYGFKPSMFCVDYDITDGFIEVNFDVVDVEWTTTDWISTTMKKVFEVLMIPHKVPGNVKVIIDDENYPWVNGRIER